MDCFDCRLVCARGDFPISVEIRADVVDDYGFECVFDIAVAVLTDDVWM